MKASAPNLFTGELELSLAFYRDHLGFSEVLRVPSDGSPEHAVLELGESRVALSTDRGVQEAGLRSQGTNAFELLIWCHDVDAEVAKLREAGARVLVDPYQHRGGHRRAYVADPAGNWVALVDAP